MLDLCSDAGINTVYLAGKRFEVMAKDISQRAVEYAREKARDAKVKISFMIQSIVDLSLGDESLISFLT